ncbi:MAG: mercury methylation corrinoid protein HgcA [Geobacteraceae bacterium]|nr:mercury methylation corrinoid protein HgcA [Geobacteraceae bacterium]
MAVISGELGTADTIGAWKARWGIGRMSYLVPPGVYAIGTPDSESPVLVSANYKMSYDLVRSTMKDHSIWLLVLETFGINVWCAAGKGTFGTAELIRRIGQTNLDKLVGHRRLLLPIMGAAGVKAIEVKKQTGFEVRFATLRIQDMPEYLERGLVATPAMRELTFTIRERLVLTPVELVTALKSVLFAGTPLAVLYGFGDGEFLPIRFWLFLALYVAAVLCGTVVFPVLLPWLPGRMFAIKGALTGLALSAVWLWLSGVTSLLEMIALTLVVSTVSAFYAMNFTGSTPYTSQSGVLREMALALPVMAIAIASSVVCLLIKVLAA